MMDDYYSYAPKKVPFVPIAITAFSGSHCRLVGSMMHQLTGLPLIDLDHWVEHKAGKSLSEVIAKHGEPHLRSMESDLLQKALNAKPPGIIALGESTLMNKANQDLINEASILVYLEYDIENLVKLLIDAKKKVREKYRGPQLEPSVVVDDINSVLHSRLPGYRKADFVVRGAGISVARLAQHTIKILDL